MLWYVLVIIGNLSPQTNKQEKDNATAPQATAETQDNDSSAINSEGKEKTPQAKIDAMMDEIEVTSYSVDDTGVTVDLSYKWK